MWTKKLRPGLIGPERFRGSAPSLIDTTPIVTGINVNADRVAGGATVIITGSNFQGSPVVTLGGVASTSVTLNGPTSITFIVPPHALPGLVDLVVTVGSQSGTLADAFSYYAGSISSVTPNYSLVSGGVTVDLVGLNFLTSSTITLGGQAMTGVVFVDATRFRAVVPGSTSGSGPADIVITEPDGITTVTATGLFIYTSVIPGQDIRRMPGTTIEDALNNAPNTCEFTVDGKSAPPPTGTGVQFTDGDVLIFAGDVQSVDQSFEESTKNLVWRVRAVDRTARLNKRRPFGTYDNQSASDVVKDLVARYAPGFSTAFVQESLARVSAVFDGSQDFQTCLSQLAQALGEGHWYIDYLWQVHFFHIRPLNSATPDGLPLSPISVGPGAAMTVTESATPIVGSMVPGYYVFRSTGRYGTVPTYGTPGVSAPPGYTQLSNEAAALCITGTVSNGEYSDGSTFFPRGWVGYNGASYISILALQNPGGAVVYFASPDVAGVLESLANSHFESAFSPLSNIILLQHYAPTFASIPISPAIGGLSAQSRRIYFTLYADAHGIGGSKTTGYIEIADNATTTLTSEPTVFYDVPEIPYVAPPTGTHGKPIASESATDIVTTTYLGYLFEEGYWSFMASGVYQDGTESLPSQASDAILLHGTKYVTLGSLPVFADVNSVPCIFRKIYGSVAMPTPDIGVPDFQPGHTGLMTIVVNNTATSATFAGGSMTGGDSVPDYPPGLPLGLATRTSSTDGPFLEDVDTPTDITLNNPYLLKNPPFQRYEDNSQLRNRIFVKGRGTIVAEDAAIGGSTLKIIDASMFSASGGRVIVGSRVLAYSSVTANSVPPLMTFALPLSSPILQADWKYGGGTPVRPFIQVDDTRSQRDLGLVELDALGQPTDGVHEYTIDDDTLSTTEQCVSRGMAELQLFSRPLVKIAYTTTDPFSRSGKIVTVNMTNPPVQGDFIIQNVRITRYKDDSNSAPRYSVEADNAARFNLNDFFLYLDSKKNGDSPSFSGLVEASSAVIASSGNLPLPTERVFMWAQLAPDNFGTTTTPIWGAVNMLPPGVAVSGTGSSTVGVTDDAGYWYRLTTGINSSREARVDVPNNQNGFWINHDPLSIFNFRTGSLVSAMRFYIGFADNLIGEATNNSNAIWGFGIRIDTSQSNQWTPWIGDGSSVFTLGSSLGVALISTQYYLKIEVQSMSVTFTLNDQAVTMDLPITMRGIKMRNQMRMFTNNGDVVKFFDIKSWYGEHT